MDWLAMSHGATVSLSMLRCCLAQQATPKDFSIRQPTKNLVVLSHRASGVI